jgi:hypothetical protein
MRKKRRIRAGLLALLIGWTLAAHAQVKVATEDGLELELDTNGRVVALRVNGGELPLLDLPGGFFVEDLMHSIPLTHFEGSAEAAGKDVIFRGRAPDLALELEAVITAQDDHIRVDGKVRDTTGEDRGLRVGFGLPVNARDFTWWDDIATSRPITTDQTYAYYGSGWSMGPNRQVSVYPFASVTGKGTGLTLAQRVDQPRFFRLFYDSTAGYCVDYNLGLSAETAKFPSSASFHFLLYRHDPEWGMRAAAQRFYEIFPEFFQVRAQRQGLYCDRVPTDLEAPEDFGFCFDLAGFHQSERKKLKAHGIYLLVHPMGTEAHIRWPKGYDWGTENGRPSLEKMEDIILTPRPEYGEGPLWQELSQRYRTTSFGDNRQRVVNSAVHGPDGHFRLFPYNETIEFIATSADPELPSPNMAEGERKYYIERHEAMAARAGSEIDGIDFDMIGISTGRTRENFRREHFRYVDHPLIYDAATGRVCIQTGMNFYEFVKEIADEMHAQGKLCTGNMASNPHTQTFFGHLLDKHGGEIQFHAPTRDLRAFRTLSFQKPVAHIIYTGTVSAGQEETVMHRWLAFGEFPNITELAFSLRGDFERGRPLYRRFIPAMQRVAYAGWEPITHAQIEGEGLFIERFGNWSDGDLHFTVHNDSDEPLTGRLIINRGKLGIEDESIWVELLGEEILDAVEASLVELEPHRTQVFHIFPPNRGTLAWWHHSSRLLVEGEGRVLEGNSTFLHARVEGATGKVKTSLALPTGWTAAEESEQSWRLRPAKNAQGGEVEISAQIVEKEGSITTLRRSMKLIQVPALELATEKLELTLDVPYPLAVMVRNNSGQSLPATVEIDFPEELGVGTARGKAQVPAGEIVAVKLELESLPQTRPGTHSVEVNLDGRRQEGELHARRGLQARRLAIAPMLDGVLDEWKNPPSTTEFERFGGGEALTQQTRVWIGYDRAALYLAFHCAEDRMAQLRASVTEPDGAVWTDDDVAIFLDPGASRSTYYQFEINALGTVFDSFNDDRTWNSDARTRARHEDAAWILEVAIPWEDLGAVARSGERWGINLGRQEKSRSETSAITSTFKKTAGFADLIFE